ncbi:hypothetical protein [Serratia aquatilis]|uniref:Lipoprotein n=1 Tax=Serratia aquatilis TaxID=1737515 RepID=A0ABV6E9A7_9GAMM
MSKTFNLIVIFTLFTLTGCTQWERAGASNNTRDAELAECTSLGYDRFPPNDIQSFELGYESEYVSCDKDEKTCPDGHRYEKTPSLKTVQKDLNEAARNAVIQACMYDKGWHQRTRFWPS